MTRLLELPRLLLALLCIAPVLSCVGEQDPAADGRGPADMPVATPADTPPADTPPADMPPATPADTPPADTPVAAPAGPPPADTTSTGRPSADTTGGPMIHPSREPSPASAVDTTPASGAQAPTAPPSPADTATWTIGLASAPGRVTAPPSPVLTALRTGTHPDYDRMTLEIGPEAGGPPGYAVEYIDRPLIECGSGHQIFPVGDAWLEVRLEPAAAHTEAGQPTLGAREIEVDGPLLLRIYRTCNFEGIVTHVMALSSPNPFRVLTLTDPWRIVVDVRRR